MLNIYMFPAGSGDFLVVEFGALPDVHYIFIDGGDKAGSIAYKRMLSCFYREKKKIDAIIFTHIHDDHICGALNAMQSMTCLPEIEKIFINTGEIVERRLNLKINNIKPEMEKKQYLHELHVQHSVAKALSIKEFFDSKGLGNMLQPCLCMGDEVQIGDAVLEVISPGKKQLEEYLKEWNTEIKEIEKKKKNTHAGDTREKKTLADYVDEQVKEDNSVINGASIAFIFRYKGHNIAFLGDAHPTVCIQGIQEFYSESITIDLMKIPHHGSLHNFSEELYKTLKTERFLLSTDGKKNKPHPAFLAKLFKIYPQAQIYCNYAWEEIYGFTKADREKYVLGDNPNIKLLKDKMELQIKDNM